MFRLHNYSPFSLGLGSGSLLLLLSSSFLDFSMNPRRLAGLRLSFKELSRRYFLHFLCFSLFSVFFCSMYLALAFSWEARNFMSQHFWLGRCSTFLCFSNAEGQTPRSDLRVVLPFPLPRTRNPQKTGIRGQLVATGLRRGERHAGISLNGLLKKNHFKASDHLNHRVKLVLQVNSQLHHDIMAAAVQISWTNRLSYWKP
ncbi:uncharacterized [Tachysurus ichikawai]